MDESSLSWTLEPSAALTGFATEWDRLNAAGKNVPILDARFFELLLSEFSSGKERLALCHKAGSIVAASLLVPRRKGVWQTFQPSQALLGPWVQHPGLSAKDLLSSLMNALPGFSLAVGLTQLDPWLIPRPREQGAFNR